MSNLQDKINSRLKELETSIERITNLIQEDIQDADLYNKGAYTQEDVNNIALACSSLATLLNVETIVRDFL